MALKPKPIFISDTAKADYRRILIEIEPLLSKKSFESFIVSLNAFWYKFHSTQEFLVTTLKAEI
jgi:hypothetical protein